MHHARFAAALLVAFGAASLLSSPVAVASGIDFVAAQDGSENNQLVLLRPANVDEPYDLPYIPAGTFAGYFASIEPGWDGLGSASDDFDGEPLLGDATVSLERVAFDDGFSMFDEDGNPLLDSNGATHTFSGDPETDEMAWHQHLVFAVDGDHAEETEITATFRLIDPEGVQAASEPFTLTFRTGAKPGSCGDLGGTCGAGVTMAMLFVPLGLMKLRRRQ